MNKATGLIVLGLMLCGAGGALETVGEGLGLLPFAVGVVLAQIGVIGVGVRLGLQDHALERVIAAAKRDDEPALNEFDNGPSS